MTSLTRERLQHVIDAGYLAHDDLQRETDARRVPKLEALVRLGLEAEVALARIQGLERRAG